MHHPSNIVVDEDAQRPEFRHPVTPLMLACVHRLCDNNNDPTRRAAPQDRVKMRGRDQWPATQTIAQSADRCDRTAVGP